ncbi:hypothetical protein K488DRAFT_85908 [Vararia minispora EC-137]|uniref:Uncharacterized protein n=1 Tax=Vararia minispora EC-137 TaxID=1314806 RepID=A0ACB8QL69_9AGAM|nr:hypothetical protein K488DRAFT_85908 [Vararia minispora EC-137]
MPDWSSAPILLRAASALAYSYHTYLGVILWELVLHLKFDLDILFGSEPRKWTFWLYLACRLLPFLDASMFAFAADIHNPIQKHISCQSIIASMSTFGILSLLASSSLMLLRAIALWDGNRVIVVLVALVLFGSLGTSIRALVLMDGIPDPLLPGEGCFMINDQALWTSYAAFLVTEVLTFFLTVTGLYRFKLRFGGTSGLWKLLYQHGLFWVVLAMLVDVPSLVLLGLDLNQVMNVARPLFLASQMCT